MTSSLGGRIKSSKTKELEFNGLYTFQIFVFLANRKCSKATQNYSVHIYIQFVLLKGFPSCKYIIKQIFLIVTAQQQAAWSMIVDIPRTRINNTNCVNQAILAGTLTGVQGDIRCKVLATLFTVK